MNKRAIPLVREAIRKMAAYKPPLEGRDPENNLLLDFNESLAPPAPAVLRAVEAFLRSDRVRVYPEYGNLTRRLAAHYGVEEGQVMLANGSDQAIEVVMRAFLEPGDRLVVPRPTFAMYAQIGLTLEARLVHVDFDAQMGWRLEALEEAAKEARMVVLANPNNPTGSLLPAGWLAGFLERHPGLPVVLDEAYADFSGVSDAGLVGRHPNLICLRTFSKAHALPSLRLGVLLAQAPLVEELLKIRGPYDINMVAVVAAEAQLDDPAPMQNYVHLVMEESKPQLEAFLRRVGAEFYPSAANFILIRSDRAAQAAAFLKSRGILVRPQRPPIEDTFRVTLGPPEVMARFMEAYSEFLAQ